ncbi:MAG: alpha/beta hydrolase [Gammaproteobacteria bacterium]|nr:MAG: alpha/beta hydrolase [Gammaproteobacteria bacterium]
MHPGYTEHHYQSVDGLSLYYRNYGSSNHVLVCLPGLSRNSKDFEELALRYAPQWRVITPDLRGRGQSDRDPDPSRYQHLTYTNDIWKLVDELEVQNFVILGTSLGGLIAMLMATQQPNRLPGIILNDIGPVIPDEAASRITQYVGRIPAEPNWQAAAGRVREVYATTFPDRPESFWLSHAHLSMRETSTGSIVPDMDPAIGRFLRKSYRKVKLVRFLRRVGLMKNAAALISDGYWQQFSEMSMPILLLHGVLSDVLPEETVEKMQAIHPEMEITTVADRGHAPFLDEPEALAAIDTFLERLKRTGSE